MALLKWSGKKYLNDMDRRLSSGVKTACLLVVRETRKALNKTGPSQELQKEFGIDKKNGPHSFDAGLMSIGGLKFRGTGKNSHTIAHGGTWTDSKGQEHAGLYWYGEPLNKWVQASPVGTPPHAQTKNLKKSIDLQIETNGLTGKVGPLDELEYARRQELGGPGSFPARPYLGPTFQANLQRIKQHLKDKAAGAKP